MSLGIDKTSNWCRELYPSYRSRSGSRNLLEGFEGYKESVKNRLSLLRVHSGNRDTYVGPICHSRTRSRSSKSHSLDCTNWGGSF